ncbi:MAG: heme o synthase [Cyanobacteria bacterium J06642_3]
MIGSNIARQNHNLADTLKNYFQLTKPRIIPLLLITTAASMAIASGGRLDPLLLVVTLAGGTLAAASAQVMNCIYDRDIDYTMVRTRKRPLPSGNVQPQHALIFAIVLGVLSFSILALFANFLAASLAMSGIVFYMLIYTHWLKRHTSQNIVIGGAAGAIPPLVGWAAVTGDLSLTPWLLFTLIFLWTPPHFWALALMLKEDYAQVGVPMLPVVSGEKATADQIWIYSLLTVFCSLLLVFPQNVTGFIYGTGALVLGYFLLHKSWQLKQDSLNNKLARDLFKYSILYMMILCAAIVVDSLPLLHIAIIR